VFHFLPSPLSTLVPFAIVLGVLVFFHELGHYLAARWCGVHVEAFSIGFGRPIARWRDRVGTEWRLSMLPLGGYVKLHGQERPQDVPSDVQALWQPGRTFHEKQVGARALVIAAGPLANFVLAVLLYAALFATAGRPVADANAVVGDLQVPSAASQAGLMVGDRIEAVGGQAVHSFAEVRGLVVGMPGKPTTLRVRRGEQALTLPVTIGTQTQHGQAQGLLGISAQVQYRRLGLGQAVVQGAAESWEVARQTVVGVWEMISRQRGAGDIGGPLRIAQLSGQAAALGLASLVNFVAVLSVNLGLVNLLPIPVLDGGHLLFYLFEALRGRPLPPRVQEYGFRAGLALLAALFVFANWNDLAHLGVMHWVAGLLGRS
jgi:regulator of sigma E protease